MIGRILSNRYKLIAELGSGGMAWVYLAEDLLQGGKVAVKVLYPQHSQDLDFVRRFAREAKLSMALYESEAEPHIVHVLDYGADQDTHYLVMEFVPGQDLGQLLEEQGALSSRQALELARQVALALEQAHHHGIVHRDVKPSNIMVQPEGTVRVLDFGIARAQASPSLTLSGFVGSPSYAAPEQAMGKQVDIRADIYALGIVLYRMLSGDLPFQGDTPWAVVSQHIAATPPPLEEIRPDLPPSVLQLVSRAMAKRPEDRFQTPAEMIEAIDAVLAAEVELNVRGAGTAVPRPQPDLDTLYAQAQRAMDAGHWYEAVDLFSRVLRRAPDHPYASQKLGEAGKQIRLASLYRAASRAVEGGQWDLAEEQLEKLMQADAGYRDAQNLWERVRREQQRPASQAARGDDDRRTVPLRRERLRRRPRGLLWAAAAVILILVAAGLYSTLARRPAASPAAALTPTPAMTSLVAPGPLGTATTWPVLSGQIAFPRFDPERATYDIYACQVDGRGCRRLVAEASQPDFSSGGRHLVFHSWRPGDKGIFVLSLEDQRLQRITAQIEAARPSADARGESYVFHSRQESDRQPRLYRTYGLEVRPLTRGAGTVPGLAPSWTPGGRILYTGCLDNFCGILLMQADGSRPRQVIAGAGQTDAEASPGGERLTFMSWHGDNWDVYVANLDGSGLRALTRDPANDGLPTWSPDGSHVAFVSNRDGEWAVWVIRYDGTGLRRLFPTGGPLDGQVQGAEAYEIQGWVEERISWAPNP